LESIKIKTMKISFKKKDKYSTLPNITVVSSGSPKVRGARMEKKYTPGGMYKIKNVYGEDNRLISSDTSRTLKGALRGVPRKGKVSEFKKGGSVKSVKGSKKKK
jgi:hypothetical protein